MPEIRTELTIDDGLVVSLRLSQHDRRGRQLTWTQQLEVTAGLEEDGELKLLTFPVRLSGHSVDLPGAVGIPAPRFILPAGGGLGYGRFMLDGRSLGYLAEHLPAIPDALTRGSAWVVLWESMLEGEMPVSAFMNLGLRGLAGEEDELIAQRLLNYMQRAFWRHLSSPERLEMAPRLEVALVAGLARAETASRKAAWFSAFRNVASTPESIAWLERLWRREETVAGLVFSETDEIDLAMELAVREVSEWESILMHQLERTKNSDRRDRLAFVMPALSADGSVRRAFFESLRDVRNRRREPWVLEAVSYLNHPLRAAESEAFLRPALELLLEIRRTGDIFFPKRWLDATLGGHRSSAAADVVREVLDELPDDYPPRLRLVILSSADELFRVSASSSR